MNVLLLSLLTCRGVDLNFLVGVQGSSYYPNLTGIFFVVSAFNQLISIIRKDGGAYAIWVPLNPLSFRPWMGVPMMSGTPRLCLGSARHPLHPLSLRPC